MENIKQIKAKLEKSGDIIIKKMTIDQKKIELIYSDVLTSSTFINDFILRRLILLKKDDLDDLENNIPGHNMKVINTDEIYQHISNGFALIFINKIIYAIEARASLDRNVSSAGNELVLQGPQDSFTENINVNLGLIRKRVKSIELTNKSMFIGKSTSSKVSLLYMNNIVDSNLVREIEKRLNTIDIDGIMDSSYLRENLEHNSNSLFPTVMATERPDKVSMALLEGKCAVVVEGSPFVLILPNFFIDFFHTVDDYYQKPFNITLIRILRLFAFVIAIFLPAFFVSALTHNHNILPLELLLNLQAERHNAPLPIFVEVLIMSTAFEILRESDIRMSAAVGSSVAILGGLILGEAAIFAGIMTPTTIVVVAISAVSGLIFSSIELTSAIRILRVIFLIVALFLGIYGIFLAFIFLLTSLVSTNNFDIPYLAPFSPFIKKEQSDALLKTNNEKMKFRNPLLSKKNKKKGKYI